MMIFLKYISRRECAVKRFIALAVLFLFISSIIPTFASGNGVEAIIRGNTAIVRIPCEWLYNYAIEQNPPGTQPCSSDSHIFLANDEWLKENLNAFDDNVFYPDNEWLKKTLDESEYTSFKKTYQEYGIASCLKIRDVSTVCDSTDPTYDRLLLNKRCIDGSWYIVFRQAQIGFKLACVYYPTIIVCHNSEIKVVDRADEEIPEYLISKTRYDGSSDNTFDRYGYTFEIYSVSDINIAVITAATVKNDFIENTVLEIGNDIEIEMSGYFQGNRAIYCCVLTDSELEALTNEKIKFISHS